MMHIDFLCWSMNGTPYLNQSFSNFDIHVCGISEHSVLYKQLYNGNYTVITKPEPAPNLLLFVCAYIQELMVHDKCIFLLNENDSRRSRIVGRKLIYPLEQEILFNYIHH